MAKMNAREAEQMRLNKTGGPVVEARKRLQEFIKDVVLIMNSEKIGTELLKRGK